ncbi:MAG: metB, partial [Ignavibacteriaceae bacterium]|nr:metB [Ignavibacteriaceae bacterium]
PDEYKGINTPIYTSNSFGYLDTDERYYPRYFNIPNQQAVIDKVSALEHASDGLVFSSGMAALSTVLFSLLNKGDHCIFQSGLYGGTMNLILCEFDRFGIEYTLLQNNDIVTFQKALKKNSKVVYIESPSNPLLSITDLRKVSEFCKNSGCISVIDNTFASPVNQNPIDSGIDIVIHSATKYLGGHSDICAGIAVAGKKYIDRIKRTSVNFGGSLNAMMCYMLERSIKTMAIRVEKQNYNAGKIAEFLYQHHQVKKVYYPGLPDHQGYEIACRQMTGFGGMLSFELADLNAVTFQKGLRLIKPSMSLGGIESTICAPAVTSHKLVPKNQREAEGISDQLLRLSVGIEADADLIEDLEHALKQK